MTQPFKVKVLINQNIEKFRRLPSGYVHGDTLVEALDFELEGSSVDFVLDCVYRSLNIGTYHDLGTLTAEQIADYHTRFPSLSVGDVVWVNGYLFACEPFGWKAVGNRQVICRICHHQCWTGDDHNVCADCRQGDWTADLECMDMVEDSSSQTIDLFTFEWVECTMDEFDFFKHVTPDEYIYSEGQAYKLKASKHHESI
jgi:hypothetical protein